MKWIEEKNHLV